MLKEKIKKLSKEYFEVVRDCRRYFHQNPELSFEEKNTSYKIRSELSQRGITSKQNFGGQYGVVSDLRPNDKYSIALRADMDALPIEEENDIPFKSLNTGVMHACGHDFHMAALLGACFILNDLKDEFRGNVRFIFQPGEEKLPGGALNMIDHGVLQNPKISKALGQHIMPDIPSGTFGFVSGPIMASADEIHIKIIGTGGHAGDPHRLVDPIMISSTMINLFQGLISSQRPAHIPMVLSIGRIIADGATNIIPDVVEIAGTFRCMDEHWRERTKKRILQICNNLAKSVGANIDINIIDGYPCLVNDTKVSDSSIDFAREYLGENKISIIEPKMYAEDFAYFSHHVPSCFFFTGVGNDKIKSGGLHTSNLNLDENALIDSMGLLSWLAIKNLASHS